MPEVKPTDAETRRTAMKKIGRYAAITAPAITLLLAASTKPTKAAPVSLIG